MRVACASMQPGSSLELVQVMRFTCKCGQIIRDNGQFDHIKGHILREQSFRVAYEQPSELIAEFIQAVAAGKREEWIERFYGQPYFDTSDSSVVFDIIDHARFGMALSVYQCEGCGRLWIEREPRQDSGTLRCFKPDETDWKGTLSDDHS